MNILPASKFAIVFMLSSAVGLSACNSSDRYSAEDHIQRAKDFQGKGDHKASIIELKNAISKNDKLAEARWLLGEAYLKQREGENAEKELLRARELGVNEESIKPALGRALLMQGRYQRVLDEATPTSATSPQNLAKLKQLRGEAQLGLNRWEEACASFQDAHETDPRNVAALRGMAKCSLQANDFDQAKSRLNEAARFDPKDADTWYLLGKVAQYLKDTPAALDAYGRALDVDPTHVSSLLDRAALKIEAQQYKEAQQDISRALKQAPNDARINYLQALLLLRQGQFAEARDSAQKILSAIPNHLPSKLIAGAASFALGHYVQAEAVLNKVVAQEPRNAYARRLLAATLIALKEPDEALRVLREGGLDRLEDIQTLKLVGEAYLHARDFAQAEAFFRKASAVDPKDSAARTGLGFTQLAQSESAEGLSDLRTAAALDKGASHQADTYLITFLLQQRKWDEALSAIGALEKKAPKSPLVHNLRGVALEGKGEPVRARQEYGQALALDSIFYPAAANMARLDLQAKHPNKAKEHFEKILSKDARHLRAMLALAELAARRGDNQGKLAWLEKAARTNPRATEPHLMLAQHYLAQEDKLKALASAHEAAALAPEDPQVLVTLGTIQYALGERDNALATYQKLAEKDPASPLPNKRIAAIYAREQNAKGAREALRKALLVKPDDAEAQSALISLEIGTKHYAEALQVARQVQQQRPGSALGLAFEGDIQLAQKQYAQAAKTYGKALEKEKDKAIAIKLHHAQSSAGMTKEADTQLAQWLSANPKDLEVLTYLASTYIQTGHNKEAMDEYRRILAIAPNHPIALNNLAGLYQQTQDPRALALAEKAYKLYPSSVGVQDTLGWILVKRGDSARGLSLLKKAAAGAPRSPEIRYHLAAALSQSGDKAAARKELEGLLKSHGPFPQRQEAEALLSGL